MNKYVMAGIICLAFLTVFTVSSADVEYIEHGWIKTKDTGIIGNHTIDSMKTISNDEFELKLKNVDADKVNTKNYDLSKIPIRIYKIDGYNNYTDEKIYKLIDTRYLNLKNKEEDILKYKIKNYDNINSYKIEIGFGTITYDGASDVIVVTNGTSGTPISFEDIYNDDVSNGWNNIIKHNRTTYFINATIQIGDGTYETFCKFDDVNLVFCKNYSNSENVIDVYNKGNLTITDSDIIVKNEKSTFTKINVDGNNSFYQSSFRGYKGTINTFTLYFGGVNNNYNYVDSCFLYKYKIQDKYGRNHKLIAKNNIITGGVYGFYGGNSDGEYENIIISDVDKALYDLDSYSNVTGFEIINSNYDVQVYDTRGSVNFIDCNTDREGNKYRFKWLNSPNKNHYRYNTFNLKTTPNSNITLYNFSGDEIFNTSSDNDGLINEYNVLVATYNYTLGEYGYIANTPFRLKIEKDGYITYNKSFNNSFQPMNYQIFLTNNTGDIGEIVEIELNKFGESGNMIINIGINMIGLLLIGALYIFSMWRKDWVICLFGTVFSLAVGISYLGSGYGVFSVGWWIGVSMFLMSIYFSFLALYFGLSMAYFDNLLK